MTVCLSAAVRHNQAVEIAMTVTHQSRDFHRQIFGEDSYMAAEEYMMGTLKAAEEPCIISFQTYLFLEPGCYIDSL